MRGEIKKYAEVSKESIEELEKSRVELEYISKDISVNIREILESISEEKFKDCLGYYRKKLNGYEEQVMEQ